MIFVVRLDIYNFTSSSHPHYSLCSIQQDQEKFDTSPTPIEKNLRGALPSLEVSSEAVSSDKDSVQIQVRTYLNLYTFTIRDISFHIAFVLFRYGTIQKTTDSYLSEQFVDDVVNAVDFVGTDEDLSCRTSGGCCGGRKACGGQ